MRALSTPPVAAFASSPPPPSSMEPIVPVSGGRTHERSAPLRRTKDWTTERLPGAAPRPGRISMRARRREQRGDPEDLPLDLVDAGARLLSTPVPLPDSFAAPIPLAYPLALAGSALVLPPATAAVLAASFVAFLALGRTILSHEEDDVVEDEGDRGDDRYAVSDLTALAGAVAAAGLLSPQGFVAGSSVGKSAADVVTAGLLPGSLIGIGAIGLAGFSVALALTRNARDRGGTEDTDRRLMDMWDDRLEREEKDGKGS